MIGAMEKHDVLAGLTIERGVSADYRALSVHHYKSGAPMGPTSIWTARLSRPTVVGRYLRRGEERLVAGVVVCTLPRLSCSLRDVATRGRYLGLGLKARADLLNREVRTIARVVIDPRLRGLGLAVRLVRHTLAHAPTVYTEALAAMGRVNPFFERAGMVRYDRPALPAHARFLDAMEEVGIAPVELASLSGVIKRLDELSSGARLFFTRELRRWHAATFFLAMDDVQAMPVVDSLRQARRQLHAQALYYLHRQTQDGPTEVERCG